MYRERIADDVYVFTSGLYAQVTASAIVTPEGAVVIDTLPFPSETRQILEFLSQYSPAGIRYLILTHYHVDHTLGASLFTGVPIIAHALCRDLLSERGASALAAAREQNPELSQVSLRLPDILFDDGELSVRLGGKTVVLTHMPGHTPDSLVAYLKDDKILFASDTMTPVPMIVEGDARRMIDSLRRLKTFGLEHIVQGHGEMILRGEINESINSNVTYLNRILALVSGLLRERQPRESVREHSIESCGKSRVPLHGLVQQFHTANLYALYDRMQADDELYKLGLRLVAERETSKADSSKSKAASSRLTAASSRLTAASSRLTVAGKKRITPAPSKQVATPASSREKKKPAARRRTMPRPAARRRAR